ncbi:tetratricopeptide repeat protein [Microbulbifer sp. 2201CG32-9]|uniref:tetratricopeptide repeat protein n=1 Tax=Microbulbifer sp. 2201CG32-9 TaxID=3232309 RepID=UPI00345BEC92
MPRSHCLLLVFFLLLTGCNKGTGGKGDSTEPTSYNRDPDVTSRVASVDTSGPQQLPGNQHKGAEARKPTYVGSDACIGCHRSQYAAWKNSHHDLAMQTADANSVLGNFEQAEFDYFGTLSRFYKKGEKFYVDTDGPTGELREYPIAYTFGVSPLQQYLIEFPGGRLQALSIAWDSRDKSEGGQRWFHLYPEEPVRHGDQLHWTGVNQNWNFMCADCHSTNLHKNYDLATDSYSTSWSDINVGCEACHGPGSKHIQWAKQLGADNIDNGLTIRYLGRKSSDWTMDWDTGIARRTSSHKSRLELGVCGQCHSRRSTSFPGRKPDQPLLDYFNLALLREPLYHADGQIKGEVFVYGSFVQSRMHAAGVTCGDCHKPHNLQLRASGNDLCAGCHMPARFDTAEHHLHATDSPGAQCINCHMPARTYMQVDARRDHSFRIPRPDLAKALGTPDVCTGCHRGETSEWAASILADRFGPPEEQHFGAALYAGRKGLPGAEAQLLRLITDESQPAIARATAVTMLPRYLSPKSAPILQAIAQGDNALLNLGLAQALEMVPGNIRPAFAIPLLYDNSRVVAALSANSLVGAPLETYPRDIRQQFDLALNHYRISETFNADRPESLTNLATMHWQEGNTQLAETMFKRALAKAPYYTPAYINLADLYRVSNREKEAEALLRRGLQQVTNPEPVQHSLGLCLVRQQRSHEAMEYLRKAAEGTDTSSRYIYVYAIALNSEGRTDSALAVLERGLQRFPNDGGIIRALASLYHQSGNDKKAQHYEALLNPSG